MPEKRTRVLRPEDKGRHILPPQADLPDLRGPPRIADLDGSGLYLRYQPITMKGRDIGSPAGADDHIISAVHRLPIPDVQRNGERSGRFPDRPAGRARQ